MNSQTLSVDMKAALGLIASFMIFLIVGGVSALLTGPFDIYILASFIVLVPYAVFFYFGWKGKRWAYLGSAGLCVVLIAVTPTAVTPDITPLLIWETAFSTMLLTLICLEGFKGYLQLAKGSG